jgi:hypothetical protein
VKEVSAAPFRPSDASQGRTKIATKISAIGIAWLALAVFAGASGAFAKLRPPMPQIVLLGLTAALLVAFWKAQYFRSWLFAISPRYLVFIHLTRFVGVYFLFLHSRGQLPYGFAVPAGWGDLMVAGTAMILLSISPGSVAGRRCYLIWNLIGLVDILFVVLTAARIALSQPDSMMALVVLPLSLLPAFLVPIIIASHIILFSKLRKSRGFS